MTPIMLMQTTDSDVIERLIGHPDIYPGSADDGTPAPADLVPTIGEGLYWLVAYLGRTTAAIFFCHPSTSTTFEFHAGVLRPYRGVIGYRAGVMAVEWMRGYTLARKLICWVETDARHVYAYAKALGFRREGVSPGSIQRRGQLKDRYLMGQSLCQWQQ